MRRCAYVVISSRSCRTSVMVRSLGGATRWARLPASGLASTAMTRSPRSSAKVLPRAKLIVVLPTPPLRLMTTTRWEPWMGARSRASIASGPLLRARAEVDRAAGGAIDGAAPPRRGHRFARRQHEVVAEGLVRSEVEQVASRTPCRDWAVWSSLPPEGGGSAGGKAPDGQSEPVEQHGETEERNDEQQHRHRCQGGDGDHRRPPRPPSTDAPVSPGPRGSCGR